MDTHTKGVQNKDLPCYECLCLAICRDRYFEDLFKCDIAQMFLRMSLFKDQLRLVRFMRMKGYYKSTIN